MVFHFHPDQHPGQVPEEIPIHCWNLSTEYFILAPRKLICHPLINIIATATRRRTGSPLMTSELTCSYRNHSMCEYSCRITSESCRQNELMILFNTQTFVQRSDSVQYPQLIQQFSDPILFSASKLIWFSHLIQFSMHKWYNLGTQFYEVSSNSYDSDSIEYPQLIWFSDPVLLNIRNWYDSVI